MPNELRGRLEDQESETTICSLIWTVIYPTDIY